jgi:hypothetical protein
MDLDSKVLGTIVEMVFSDTEAVILVCQPSLPGSRLIVMESKQDSLRALGRGLCPVLPEDWPDRPLLRPDGDVLLPPPIPHCPPPQARPVLHSSLLM